VREALPSIKTCDRDEWAAAWIALSNRYYAKAQAAAPASPEANANHLRAALARAQSPGKQRACKALDPPLEIVRIPFEGSQIIAYMRLPNTTNPVPVVLEINGLDSRKENLLGAILPHGNGVIAVDGPGIGEAPIKVSETADRMFSRVIDFFRMRPEIDTGRIIVHGVSLGGCWSAKLAITEHARIGAATA
jgi:hypothetical protein